MCPLFQVSLYYTHPPPLVTSLTSPHTEKLYRHKDYVEERHRHRYEVNPEYVENLEEKGLKFVGRSTDNRRMEILELEGT